MSKTKDLTKFSAERLQEFLASFDIVMSDIDGVVWHVDSPIQGGLESLAALQKLGKQVYLVTNNSVCAMEYYHERARCAGLDINLDHIINISKVIVWYLKKIDFRGEVFAIVPDAFRRVLTEAGIRMVEEPKAFETDLRETQKQIVDRPSVKAVITDFDFNCNWPKLALAVSCLRRKDVLYISGARDLWVGTHDVKILGPGSLTDVISGQSGKRPILCAKPSQMLRDYILDICNVDDPQRCLFIGDTVDQDMKFASMCGFMKLFVGTGCDTLEETQKEDDACPDYYLPALSQLFLSYEDPQRRHTASNEDS